jgi:hypothetical protein
MKTEMKIFFIGDDHAFYESIEERFSNDYNNKYQLEFKTINFNEFSSVENLFLQIHQELPQIIYIDFDKNFTDLRYLSKLLTRDNITKLIANVALYSDAEFEKNYKQIMLAGIRLHHKKGKELHDIIYNALSFVCVEAPVKPDYFTVDIHHKTNIFQDLRIGYIDNSKFHIETNSPLNSSPELTLEDHSLRGILESKKFLIKSKSDQDLYYDHRFSYDLHFKYVDLEKEEIDKEGNVKLIPLPKKELDYALAQKTSIIEQLDKWILKRKDIVKPKITKILVIDNELSIYNQLNIKLSEFPYSLTIQKKLISDNYVLSRKLPDVIVFKFSDPDQFGKEEETESSINESENNELQSIVATIKKTSDYTPTIIIFNDQYLLKKCEYERTLTYQGELSLELLSELVKKVDNVKRDKFLEYKRVYFATSSEDSLLSFKRDIEIISINESIIYFYSETEIPPWTLFSIKDPFPVLLTVIPHKENSKYIKDPNIYRSMIHGTGEIEKQEIRRRLATMVQEENSKENQGKS